MKKHFITQKLIARYEQSMRNDEKSQNTVAKYLHDLRRFSAFAQGRPVDKNLTLEYKAEIGTSHTPSGANSMIAALNSFFRFAGWDECVIKQLKVQKKAYCSENSELSRNDYFALVRTAERRKNLRLALLLQTLCSTGIRVSEVPFITVEAIRSGEARVFCKGKIRRIFIISALRKKLLEFIKSNNISQGPIFITRTGKPMNRSNIWREMKALCAAAGVSAEKVFPHNFRHLFARTFYEMEKDIAKLADILGHSSINTTRIYIVTTGVEHRRRMERMHLIV